jgi:hypothetical protein
MGSQLDDADQEEDHEHDDDHADDSDPTASVVHPISSSMNGRPVET